MTRIILVRPELGCVEGELETVFARLQVLLRSFEAGNVDGCRDQPDDFALPPLRLVAAMDELRLVSPVRHLGVELDLLTGEALADVGLDDREGFVADDLGDAFADYLLGRKSLPLRDVPVDELVAGFGIKVRDGDRGVVGDKAQLALALAQQIGGSSKLRHQRVDLGDGRYARRQRAALSGSERGAGCLADRARDNPAQP